MPVADVFGFNTKKTGSIIAFFCKFAIFFRFYMFINIPYFASVDASTLAQYIFHVYLVVNPKRVFEFITAITVGLQDINSFYITLENPYVYILYVLFKN